MLATVSCPSLDEVEGTSSGPSDSVALGVNFVYKHFAQPSSIETAELLKKERSDSDQAVLVSRIIDRAIRPRFPEQLPGEIMVSCLALAHDPGEGIEALAVNAVSACLSSRKDIPFDGPIAAVRICKVDGKMLVDPSVDQIRTAEFDLLYVGSKTGAVMVEFSGDNVLEKEVKKAFKTAQQKVVAIIEQLNKQLAKNVQSSESEEQISNFDVSNQNQIKIALKEKIYPLLLKQLSQIFWQKLSSKVRSSILFFRVSFLKTFSSSNNYRLNEMPPLDNVARRILVNCSRFFHRSLRKICILLTQSLRKKPSGTLSRLNEFA